ncbi:hypothetical protein SEA_ISSMI_28 [Streptomyces phage Issmi]|uniref:Uncharacterized protein n=1 Tax=Streptomyces phage Issmi TaxID=2725628 RepID=A0A6M3TAN0_9CAUD|nr:hypothetical protein KGG87_gp28 [Streptomyces phage Issmi]QJD50674.1 hypothetical protein SEA_ISSMI_28 [Streptomyces phage Issmi]
MSPKHARLSGKGLGAIARALPTKYKSKTGLVTAALGVAVSLAVYFETDYPQLALVVQALTALGYVEQTKE